MKIALIGTNLVEKSQIDKAKRYNIALSYITAYVKNTLKDIDIEIIDIPVHVEMDRAPERYIKRIYECDADIYGFSSYCWDKDIILRIIKGLRRRRRDAKIIIGGPTATYDGEEILKRNREIDYAVVGEGEITFKKLIESNFRGKDIRGLFYRDRDKIVFSGYSEPITDLDIIPSPYINGLVMPEEMDLMLGFSRGCINRCKHCAWRMIGGGVRYFSKDRVVEELLWAKEHKYKHIFIYDSSINSSATRLKDISDAIGYCKLNSDLSFTYFIDHTRWDSHIIKLLSNINARCVFVGLESVSKASSLSLGRKPVDVNKFERFVKDITRIAPIVISIMIGIPTESGLDFEKTVDYVVSLVEKYGRDRIVGIRVFWTIITPGSRLFEESKRYGIRFLKRGIPYIISSKSFTKRDMVSSFNYLLQHKYRDIFIWEDKNPELIFGELKGFDLMPEMPRER